MTCARCHSTLKAWVYSPWTGQRYCVDLTACEKRAARKSNRPGSSPNERTTRAKEVTA